MCFVLKTYLNGRTSAWSLVIFILVPFTLRRQLRQEERANPEYFKPFSVAFLSFVVPLSVRVWGTVAQVPRKIFVEVVFTLTRLFQIGLQTPPTIWGFGVTAGCTRAAGDILERCRFLAAPCSPPFSLLFLTKQTWKKKNSRDRLDRKKQLPNKPVPLTHPCSPTTTTMLRNHPKVPRGVLALTRCWLSCGGSGGTNL